MKEQIEETIDLISEKIEKLQDIQNENLEYIKEDHHWPPISKEERIDRQIFANEIHKMIELARVEKEFLVNNYWDKYAPSYKHVPDDLIKLLNKIFNKLIVKLNGGEGSRLVKNSLLNVMHHPKIPQNDISVSIEYENSIFHIIYNHYKIELSKWVREYQEFSNDRYEVANFSFSPEENLEYTHNFDEFKYDLLNILEEVDVKSISVSEEE